jgi:hypothetical protein
LHTTTAIGRFRHEAIYRKTSTGLHYC